MNIGIRRTLSRRNRSRLTAPLDAQLIDQGSSIGILPDVTMAVEDLPCILFERGVKKDTDCEHLAARTGSFKACDRPDPGLLDTRLACGCVRLTPSSEIPE